MWEGCGSTCTTGELRKPWQRFEKGGVSHPSLRSFFTSFNLTLMPGNGYSNIHKHQTHTHTHSLRHTGKCAQTRERKLRENVNNTN